MREFELEDLGKYNGEDGAPAYVAYEGRIYDVSGSPRWKKGGHMRLHQAGEDLSTDIQSAPHGADLLDKFPQVGVLKTETEKECDLPEVICSLMDRFPFLRRHPHPMTVHFPIAFMIFTTVFNLLYLVTGVESFESTAFHCLVVGVLFSLVGIGTGILTWRVNFQGNTMRRVTIKVRASMALLATGLVALLWRLAVPDMLTAQEGPWLVYLLLNLLFIPFVSLIGWHGARLTFPVRKKTS